MSAKSSLVAAMKSWFFSTDFKHKTLDPREHKLSTNFHKWLLPLNDDESFIHFEFMTFAVLARSKFSSHSPDILFCSTRPYVNHSPWNWILQKQFIKSPWRTFIILQSCSLPAIKFSSSMLSRNQIIFEQFATRSLAIKLQILFLSYHKRYLNKLN